MSFCGDAPSTEVPKWYAVHTRHQHESVVQRQLEGEGLTTYLPLIREVRQWSDRKKQIEVPLFSCFLFVRGVYNPQLHHTVVKKPGVLGFVGIGKQGIPIPEAEIDGVRRLLAARVPLSPYPFVTAGQKVRIRGGVLDNLEGIVISNTGRKLVVSIETIQRSVAVQLEDAGYGIETIPVFVRPGRVNDPSKQTVVYG